TDYDRDTGQRRPGSITVSNLFDGVSSGACSALAITQQPTPQSAAVATGTTLTVLTTTVAASGTGLQYPWSSGGAVIAADDGSGTQRLSANGASVFFRTNAAESITLSVTITDACDHSVTSNPVTFTTSSGSCAAPVIHGFFGGGPIYAPGESME